MEINIQLQQALKEIERLRKENEYLKKLLSQANILKEEQSPFTGDSIVNNLSAPFEKIALFKRLFKGRNDVYAVRW